MREVLKVVGFILAIAVIGALVMFLFLRDARGSTTPDDRTQFIQGLDYGRIFLRPGSKKGQRYRAGISEMIAIYRAWIWKYARYDVVPMGSRIWLESRGNPWSKTKDAYLLEAGLTSVGYEEAYEVCKDWGVCGDPCGDPELAIAIGAYSKFTRRQTMLEGDNFWTPWLPELAKAHRWEAEAFIGVCGAINCQKIRKAIAIADKQDGFFGHVHKWWAFVQFLRDKTEGEIAFIFEGVKKYLWTVGTRVGRVEAQLHMRAEFKAPRDGQPDYGFGDDLAWFPMKADGTPDFPTPLYPFKKFPKKDEWRTQCVLYGTPQWHKVMGEPKKGDRWKKGGLKYDLVGKPINVKKGQKKYPTQEDFEAAHDAWIEGEVASGRRPSPHDNALAAAEMSADGWILP